MILVIDNYDSFTYNLVQYLGELGAEMQCLPQRRHQRGEIRRPEAQPPRDLARAGQPRRGGYLEPGDPSSWGRQSPSWASAWATSASAGLRRQVVRAPRLMHGKTSPIYHYGDELFQGVPSPFEATRYHSLIVAEPLPAALEVTAFTTRRRSDGACATANTRSTACSSTPNRS